MNTPDHIYYNLKIANIDTGLDDIPANFQVTDNASKILHKQSAYKMAIQSFRLNMSLPLFLFPIAEGFVDPLVTGVETPLLITNITTANPAVFTTATNHNFSVEQPVRLVGINGINGLDGSYFVNTIVSPTQFTVKSNSTGQPINGRDFWVYGGGGKVQVINNDVNRTRWGVCLRYNNIDYHYPVFYISDRRTDLYKPWIPKPPSENNGLQDFSTSYYECQTFESICRAINTALYSAFDKVNTAGGAGTLDYPPQFVYDSDKQRFELIWDIKMKTNNVSMYCNNELLNYFPGFAGEFQGYNQPNYKDFLFIIANSPPTFPYLNRYAWAPQQLQLIEWTDKITPINSEFLKYTQEYDARYKFDQIVSVVIISDYIKVRNEFYPRLGNPNSVTQIGRNNNNFNTGTLNIIASFDLIDTGGNIGWREVLHYQPQLYKWIDLVSDDPLDKVDCRILLETVRGELIPAKIPPESQSNIRFLFKKI